MLLQEYLKYNLKYLQNININITKHLTNKKHIMKKNLMKAAVLFFFTSFAFASTLEVKTQEIDTKNNLTICEDLEKEKDITICYEISRTEKEINEFITEVTTTYMCYTHPGLGNGTVYIDAEK